MNIEAGSPVQAEEEPIEAGSPVQAADEPVALPAEPTIDSVPGVPFTELPWEALHPSYIHCERIAGAIFWAILLVATLVGLTCMIIFAILGMPAWSAMIAVGSLVLLASFGALLWFWPKWSYDATRWRATDGGLEIQRGVWWRHHVYVPRQRIQHTDVIRGPLLRRFGLATLVVHTAGTHNYEIQLEGLDFQRAESLRQTLLPEDHRGN